MRTTLIAIAAVTIAGIASAEVSVSIPLSIGAMDSVTSQTYSCGDGAPFSVQYVNSGANVLAILPVDGEDRIFVNVVSGSGARYVSGGQIWWVKGDTATLENEMQGGSVQNCRTQATPSSD